MSSLHAIAHSLLVRNKGILAADESDSTCAKRFDKYGIAKTPETRRKWRELLFSTAGVEKCLSGIILYDETLRQSASVGEPFAVFLEKRGIIPGIKVDQKTEPLGGSPEEEVTKGLDGLPERLTEYAKMGAKFTKWRAVIRIDEEKGLPTKECIAENAKRLAEYARASEQAGLVPIVEPEVLIDGTHTIGESRDAIIETLRATFDALKRYRVDLRGIILKSSMALPGKESGIKASPQEVADETVKALMASVPHEVPGVVFLSGGQSPEEATQNLNAMAKQGPHPWRLTFSYSRALQDPVMAAWMGDDKNIAKAQKIFRERVQETSRASEGEFE